MGQSIQAKLSTAILIYACFSLTPTVEASESHHQYVEKVVEAIYKAEGGAKTRHPYGIVSIKVKGHKEARKACFEVVNWRYAIWQSLPSKGRPDFISYLSKSYCPIGAKNDPTGLNRNWPRLVNYFMERG